MNFRDEMFETPFEICVLFRSKSIRFHSKLKDKWEESLEIGGSYILQKGFCHYLLNNLVQDHKGFKLAIQGCKANLIFSSRYQSNHQYLKQPHSICWQILTFLTASVECSLLCRDINFHPYCYLYYMMFQHSKIKRQQQQK